MTETAALSLVGEVFGDADDIARLDAMEKAVKNNMPIALLTAADRLAARKNMKEALYDLWETDLWKLRKQRNGESYDSFRAYAAERLKVTPSRISQLISSEHEDRLARIAAGDTVRILEATRFSPRQGGTRGPRSVGTYDTASVILARGGAFVNDAGQRINAISDEDNDGIESLAAAHKAFVTAWNIYADTLRPLAAAGIAAKEAAAKAKAAEKAKVAKAREDAKKAKATSKVAKVARAAKK